MNAPSTARPTWQKETREIVKDLFPRNAFIYWTDMLLSSALGWMSLFALVWSPYLWVQIIAYPVSVIALFRAALFIHEISHFHKDDLPGFVTAWNWLIGVPMMVPSFIYEGVHTEHHKKTLYGTKHDPEYLPLALGSRWAIVWFIAETVFVPVVFFLRFTVLSLIGLLVPPFHVWLERRASSMGINFIYERKPFTPAERSRAKRWELAIIVFAVVVFAAMIQGLLPWTLLLAWYAVSFGVLIVNQVRTLGAHRYTNDGGEMDIVGQLLDSVNVVPGHFWTEFWAPVGLRYHALHHFLPDMPYHGLPEAHRRLLAQLPPEAPYRQANYETLTEVIAHVWKRPGEKHASLQGS